MPLHHFGININQIGGGSPSPSPAPAPSPSPSPAPSNPPYSIGTGELTLIIQNDSTADIQELYLEDVKDENGTPYRSSWGASTSSPQYFTIVDWLPIQGGETKTFTGLTFEEGFSPNRFGVQINHAYSAVGTLRWYTSYVNDQVYQYWSPTSSQIIAFSTLRPGGVGLQSGDVIKIVISATDPQS